MRDLEIRGAGNLLGTAQSGHIIAVGFDSTASCSGRPWKLSPEDPRRVRAPAGLRIDFLSTEEARWNRSPARARWSLLAFFATSRMRGLVLPAIAGWRRRRIAHAIDELRAEWRDRFGPLPSQAENALLTATMRIEAARRKITMVEVRDRRLMLTQRRELLQKDGKVSPLDGLQPRLYVARDFIQHRNDSLSMTTRRSFPRPDIYCWQARRLRRE